MTEHQAGSKRPVRSFWKTPRLRWRVVADASAPPPPPPPPPPAEWWWEEEPWPEAAACAAADLPLDGVPDGAGVAAWWPLGFGVDDLPLDGADDGAAVAEWWPLGFCISAVSGVRRRSRRAAEGREDGCLRFSAGVAGRMPISANKRGIARSASVGSQIAALGPSVEGESDSEGQGQGWRWRYRRGGWRACLL